MFRFLKDLLLRKRRGPAAAFQGWAQSRGFEVHTARRGEGLVVHGKQGRLPWRMEWGAAQRSYIHGREWRCFADLDLPAGLHVLVLDQGLREATEQSLYSNYVDVLQTRADADLPAELRWLMMLDEVQPAALGHAWKRGYTAVASDASWAARWLSSPWGKALLGDSTERAADQPLVAVLVRGRLALRTRMDVPDDASIARMQRLFEHALREAHRLLEPTPATRAADAPGSNPRSRTTEAVPGVMVTENTDSESFRSGAVPPRDAGGERQSAHGSPASAQTGSVTSPVTLPVASSVASSVE